MKQMLKGIDILLYSGSTSQTISNVLAGQPTSNTANKLEDTTVLQGLTLGIPKGDTNDWDSRIVEFFGQRWRTVGMPLQGIEENIPLFWHKQVNVQRLDISGDCTVYESDTYTKHVFQNVYFFDERTESTKTGTHETSGFLTVRIYADKYRADNYRPKQGDIIVINAIDFIFDTSTQQAESQSMAQFRQLYPEYAVINDVKSVLCGSIPDYEMKAV